MIEVQIPQRFFQVLISVQVFDDLRTLGARWFWRVLGQHRKGLGQAVATAQGECDGNKHVTKLAIESGCLGFDRAWRLSKDGVPQAAFQKLVFRLID